MQTRHGKASVQTSRISMLLVGLTLLLGSFLIAPSMAAALPAPDTGADKAAAAGDPGNGDQGDGQPNDNRQSTDTNGGANADANPNAGKTATGANATGNIKFNTANIARLSGWLAWAALMTCIIGICISAALWAAGSKGQNPGQELTGKKGIILCCTAAFFVGALPAMLSFLEDKAREADVTGVTGSAGTGIATGTNNAYASQRAGGKGNQQTNGKNAQPYCTLPNGSIDRASASCH
jgi:hypothetical protein